MHSGRSMGDASKRRLCNVAGRYDLYVRLLCAGASATCTASLLAARCVTNIELSTTEFPLFFFYFFAKGLAKPPYDSRETDIVELFFSTSDYVVEQIALWVQCTGPPHSFTQIHESQCAE